MMQRQKNSHDKATCVKLMHNLKLSHTQYTKENKQQG